MLYIKYYKVCTGVCFFPCFTEALNSGYVSDHVMDGRDGVSGPKLGVNPQ